MKINLKYRQSLLSRVVDYLFSPKIILNLKETKAMKALLGLNYPILSGIFLSLTIMTLFFEGLLVKILPISISFVTPLFLIGSFILSDKKRILASKNLIWYFIFLFVAMLSSVTALTASLSPKMLLMGFLLYAQFGFAMLIGQTIKIKRIISGFCLTGLPIALVGIYQFLFRVQTSPLWVSSTETGLTTRAFGFFGSPNVFGILMAILSIIAIGFLISEKKWSLSAFSISFILAMIFSFSRTAWLGFGIGIGVMLIFINWHYIFLGFLAPPLLFVSQIRTRIISVFSINYAIDSSLDGRLWAIKNGLYIFQKRPIFGTGPGTYGGQIAANYSSPIYHMGLQNGYVALYFTDNQWLEILVQTGILGVLSFLGFIISTIWALIDNFLKEKNLLILSSLAILVCFLVCGFAANVLEFGAIAVPVGLILGSALNES